VKCLLQTANVELEAVSRRSYDSSDYELYHNQVDSSFSYPLVDNTIVYPIEVSHDVTHNLAPQVNCDSCCMRFWFQSANEVEGTTETANISEKQNETVTFLESTSNYSTGSAASHPASAIADATPDVSLTNFLSRPVKIYSYTWNEADAIGTAATIYPWQLFFNNTTIKQKLDNYAWLRCDLKVKIMVNASPFYYGATLVSYLPLPFFKSTTIVNDAATRYFIPLSQRPHLWIYPQNNEGGEMTLPFFLYKDYMTTVSNDNFIDMGALTFTNITSLDSANGAVGTGVTVTVYAWAENVVVSGPSAGLMLQSKDEYGRGPISSVASAVASAAKALSRIPIIKPYATATQIGAEGIASIASKLGYCNTPVISEAQPFRHITIPVLSSTEQGYPVDKLTIDPKNELSVDPQIVGLPPIDELNIQHLIGKESYLCTTTWSSSSSADTLLFQTAVAPSMFDIETSANPKLYQTPLCFVANLFQYWRGDIIFRFRFICTQYHRGRVRIVFDPSASAAQNITTTALTQPMCFNEVIDLTKDTNIEVRVPYNQAFAWLQTSQPTSSTQIPWTISSTPTFNHVEGRSNGTMVLRVVTALTGPLATTSIPVIVSVRGAENLEFAAPHDLPQRYSQFAPQSKDEYEVSESQKIIAGNAPSGDIPEKYLINFGEKIFSLRQILRRYNLTSVRMYPSIATNVWQVGYHNHSAIPIQPGYDPAGQYSAKGLIATATDFPYNYVTQNPLTYISSAFIGYRGSVFYVVTNNSNGTGSTASNMRVVRLSSVANPGYGVVTTLGTNLNTTAKWFTYDNFSNESAGGQAMVQSNNTNGLNYSCPMYSRYKFLSLDKISPTSTTWNDDDRELFQFTTTIPASSSIKTIVYEHVAIGTDFNCHFFINVPTFYVYSAIPNPT